MKQNPARPALTDLERVLLGYLHRWAPSPVASKTINDLVREMRARRFDVGRREIEFTIQSLRWQKGRPVGSCSGGIFAYHDRAGAAVAIKMLWQHVRSQLAGLRAARRTAQDVGSDQMFLDLQEAGEAYDAAKEESESLFPSR